MTPETNDNEKPSVGQADFSQLLKAKMVDAVRITLVAVMNEELERFVGASWGEIEPDRHSYRNGYRERSLVTTAGKIEALKVPRARMPFTTQVFTRYKRRQADIDIMIGDMFVKGVSTEGVGQVLEGLNGAPASKSTVSRVHQGLQPEYEAWKRRELPERYEYMFADGTYFSVIYDNEAHKTPILALIGITPQGKREVVGFTIGERENQGAWENLLDDVKSRGIKQVGLWVTDGHQAMLGAINLKFPNAQRQRCMLHKTKNVLAHVPEKQRDDVGQEFKAIFYQASRSAADQTAAAFRNKYANIYPSAVECMDRDWPACLTFYAFPRAHWPRIRTSNVIERTFEEVKKRTKKMSAAFRNEASCLLMFYAIVRGIKFQNVVMPQRDA